MTKTDQVAVADGTLAVGARVVMVSGGARGIGQAITNRLLDEGYRLSIGVRDVAKAREIFAEWPGDRFLCTEFDALEPASAETWVNDTVEAFGQIDALVNNAGIWKQVNFDTGDEADLDAMWEVNAKAPFRLTRLTLPHLRKCGHGRVVNIASTDGIRFRDSSCSIGYTMSKHALMAVSHATRQFGYDDGVRATALCPGAVATEMIAGLPGVTPTSQQLDPATIAGLVTMLLQLPNNASVAWMPVNTRLESTL